MAKSTFKEEHDLGTFLLVFGVLILAFDHVVFFLNLQRREVQRLLGLERNIQIGFR